MTQLTAVSLLLLFCSQAFAQLTGDFERHTAFASKILDKPRNLTVFLPPGYTESNKRYPVLYMHDGQNLFDPATGFAGQEWHMDETASRLIAEGKLPPLIIVGIWNTSARMQEYTNGAAGKSAAYGRMIIEELMPFIDSKYRTLTGPQNTGLGGSSLGGLVTMAIALEYPNVFGKLAIVSPSVWWENQAILQDVGKYAGTARPKIWLDIGTNEGRTPEKTVADTRLLRDALVAKGWKLNQNLAYMEAEGAAHNEKSWAARVGPMLEFLWAN
jgi:predicted alpha/beta superfamily hydrolase